MRVWVVGAAVRTEARKCVPTPVLKRNRQTYSSIIRVLVNEGSVIYTDSWRGYSDLEHLGYSHHTVSCSGYFVVSTTDVQSNNIEGTWAA